MRASPLLGFALLLLAGPLAACATTPPMERGGQPALAGRTVVITGASSGFGRGIAVAMAQRGANVVLAARRAELLEQVAAEARAAGGQALVVPTDVSKPEAVAQLAQAAEARFGRVDVWINNAGIGALGRFDETPVADHNRIVDVNLKGVIHGSHEALGRFRRQGHGTLINMGSVVSQVPMPYYASYVATKHAVLGLSEALNQELRANGEGRRIRVVTVMPWAADTPWFDQAGNYSGRRPAKIMPDQPETIVNAVVAATLAPRDRVAPGLKAKAGLTGHRLFPNLSNAVAGRAVHTAQAASPPDAPSTSGTLYQPLPSARGVRGQQPAYGVSPPEAPPPTSPAGGR